jgi:hypothetical protein
MPEHPDSVAEVRESIRNTIHDPVARSLLQSSQLTTIQLETLLAASFSNENHTEKGIGRLCRPSKSRISRGAYNRTLIQAQNNVIRSIYTVLLLGYLGLFDSPALQPFLELSDTIQGFVQEVRQRTGDDRAAIRELNSRLMDTVNALAKRESFKDRL